MKIVQDDKLAVVIQAPQPESAWIIWLHGLGANGHDFVPMVSQLSLTYTQHTRFIFPHAPNRAITINGGMMMPGWYDILGMDITAQQDVTGIQASSEWLHDLIERAISAGIESQRIILAGFSQGGAIALHAGLSCSHPLGGIMALSTYLPLAEQFEHYRHHANDDMPIFMGHGTDDDIVLFSSAQRSHDYLQQHDYSLIFKSYPMMHSVCAEEIVDFDSWLQQRIA